jgi:uncharacterized iron-regulated protein
MNKHLKTLKRYETRDGVVHNEHELAIRHEYFTAIPKQLGKLIKEKCIAELSDHTANAIAEAIMGDAQNVIEILSDFLENAEAVNEMDQRIRSRETANHILVEKGFNALPQEAGNA